MTTPLQALAPLIKEVEELRPVMDQDDAHRAAAAAVAQEIRHAINLLQSYRYYANVADAISVLVKAERTLSKP